MAALSGNRLSLFSLYALVIGSMIGAANYSLPRTFAVATGPFSLLIALCVAAGGLYGLARVFQAHAGSGDFPGFLPTFAASLSHAAWRRKALRSFDGWASVRREGSQ